MSNRKFFAFIVAACLALSAAACSKEVQPCTEGRKLKFSHNQPIWAGKTLVFIPVYVCKVEE